MKELFTGQGIESLLATTPDHWTDRQSGFALNAELNAPNTGSLRRIDSHTLASVAPATSFALKATVLASVPLLNPPVCQNAPMLLGISSARATIRRADDIQQHRLGTVLLV